MTEAARAVRTAQLIHSGLIRSGQPASAPNRLAADSAGAAGRPNGAGAARGVGDRGAPGGAAAAVAAAVAPAEPEQEKERHLRVVEAPVRTPAQRRRRARILLASAAGLAAIVAFGLVYLHVVLAQRQFALDRINAQVQTAQANYQQLRLKVAELGSPQHIITNAEGPLGMHQPTAVTYVTPTTRVAGSGATASTSTGAPPTVTQAPAGDADWPSIKSQLAGSP
jgi:cell division protein FtsL